MVKRHERKKYLFGAAGSRASKFAGAASASLCIGLFLILAIDVMPGQVPDPTPHVRPKEPKPTPTPVDPADDNPKSTDKDPAVTAPAKKPKRGSLILAPIPIFSPALGSGIVLGVGYVFRLNPEDKVSPQSTVGIAAAFTNNGSRGAGVFGKFYFSENKYQTTIAFGKGKVNYEFFGIGRIPGREPISVDIKQSANVFFGEFMRNVGRRIFIGPRFQYRKLTADLFEGTTTPGGFVIPAIDVTSTTVAIGFHVQRDTMDNPFYPTKGSLFNFTGDFFAKPLGSNRTYQTYKISYNGYHKIREKQVLAYRGMACQVSDNTPFFDLCLFGASSDLRGYTAGQFQNRRMFATQAEYRLELPYRLGLVGFAGVGSVAPTWGDFRFGNLLPAAGVGLRFKLDKINHINYRIDLGFGRAGRTLSLSVTEAF